MTAPVHYGYAIIYPDLNFKEDLIMAKKIILCLALLLAVSSMALAYPAGSDQSSYPVSIFAGPGGHLDPEGQLSVAAGTVLQIAIMPDQGYHCVMFTVNGKSFFPQSYISVTVNQNTTVSVFFEKN
jgi:hypothetical protein